MLQCSGGSAAVSCHSSPVTLTGTENWMLFFSPLSGRTDTCWIVENEGHFLRWRKAGHNSCTVVGHFRETETMRRSEENKLRVWNSIPQQQPARMEPRQALPSLESLTLQTAQGRLGASGLPRQTLVAAQPFPTKLGRYPRLALMWPHAWEEDNGVVSGPCPMFSVERGPEWNCGIQGVF